MTKEGTGSGTVTSSAGFPPLNCGSTCSGSFAFDSTFYLTASPDSNSSFAGWLWIETDGTPINGSLCSPSTAATCTFHWDSAHDVWYKATFNILPPVAAFTVSTSSGSLPLSVRFTDQSVRVLGSWLNQPHNYYTFTWDFGDGQNNIDEIHQQNPTHLYKAVGTYTATLLVTNPSGTSQYQQTITVAPCPNLPVRIVRGTGASPTYYPNLNEAYNAALDGDTIQALATNFIEDIISSKTLTITGGYSCDYSSQVGSTILQGSITVNDGILTIGDFVLATNTDNIYSIVATAGAGGGTISPTGTVGVAKGDTMTFMVTPDPGYLLLDVLIDGASAGLVSSYTFTNITTNHTIEAIFGSTLTITTFGTGSGTVTVTSPEPGISCGTGCTEYKVGTVVTLTASPSTTSTFEGWSGGGCSGKGTCQVTMNADTAVTALFTILSTPTNLSATPVSPTQINLSWSENGTNQTGFVIQRKTGAGGTYAQAGTTTGTVNSFSDTGLTPGTIYYYRVKATAGTSYSSYSAEANATTLDTAPPTGSIVINNSASLTNNAAVTLNLSAQDDSGQVSSMRFSNDNVTWSAIASYATSTTWTLSSGDGSKTVYAKFMDNAGNWSIAYNDTIILDTTKPTGTISINSLATYVTTTSVTLTLSATDANGVSQMQFSNDNVTWSTAQTYAATKSWSLTTGDGTKTVYVKFKDNAGNWSSVYSDTTILDTTKPTGTISINSLATYVTTTSVTLTLSATDANGVSQMQFSNDNVTWSTAQTYAATKSWNLTTGDGTKTVYVKFKDNAGIWSSVYSDTTILDTIKPTGTISINSLATYVTTTSVTLTLSATDANGVSQMQFSNDNVTWSTAQTYAATKSWNLTTGDGTKTVYVKFKDNAGNWSSVYSDTTILDTIKPTGTISINSGSTYAISFTVTLNLTAADANGVSQMQFSNDNVTWSTAQAYATTKSWTLTSGDGTKTVYAKFKDNAGNWSVSYSDTITLATCSAYPVRIVGTPPGCYSTIQAAYNAAPDGATIQVHNVTLTENLNANSATPKTIILEGGYNADYSGVTGATTLNGSITTTTGKLTIKNFILQQ